MRMRNEKTWRAAEQRAQLKRARRPTNGLGRSFLDGKLASLGDQANHIGPLFNFPEISNVGALAARSTQIGRRASIDGRP